MSALIMVRTGAWAGTGDVCAVCGSAKASSPRRSGRVSQSWLPSKRMRSGTTPHSAKARSPASRRPVMMPHWSISSGLAWPTPQLNAHRLIFGTMSSRATVVRSLESLTPYGAEREARLIATTPTLTGPARAPRPTSSIPIKTG